MEENICKQSDQKGLISKIYKQLMQLYIKKKKKIQSTQLKKWADLNFSQRRGMAKNHMKTCSTSLIIREMQIKTTMSYNFTQVRMAIIIKSTNNKCWRGCGERETSYTVDGNVNWYGH